MGNSGRFCFFCGNWWRSQVSKWTDLHLVTKTNEQSVFELSSVVKVVVALQNDDETHQRAQLWFIEYKPDDGVARPH